MDFSPENKMCSFCGKPGTKDTEFIGGLGVMICVECLDFYHEAVHDPPRNQAMRRPPWESMSGTELLATLPLIYRSAEQVSAFAVDWVGLIRQRGISWTEIGKALGVSRQAAWMRFSAAEAQRSEEKA